MKEERNEDGRVIDRKTNLLETCRDISREYHLLQGVENKSKPAVISVVYTVCFKG